MQAQTLLAFILAATLIELTPGPNMGYLAVLALSEGRRAGLAATAGVAAGLLGAGIAASAGLAAIVATSNLLYEILRWCGAAYLVWLAIEGWREAPEEIATAVEPATHGHFFVRGLITNLLNPKAALFYLSVFPTFISDERSVLSQTTILLAVYVMVATIVHSSVVLAAGAMRPLLQDRTGTTRIRRALSSLLVLVAAWFLFTTHRAAG